MKHTVMALHRYSRNLTGRMKHNGQFDKWGSPVMRADPERFVAGDIFVVDDEVEDLADLLEREAVRYLDETELALWEKQQRNSTSDVVG